MSVVCTFLAIDLSLDTAPSFVASDNSILIPLSESPDKVLQDGMFFLLIGHSMALL